MTRGAAQHELDLLDTISRLRRSGSVNATLAALREVLGWDKPDAAKSKTRDRPDNEAAVAELEVILRRFRAPGAGAAASRRASRQTGPGAATRRA
jgi:hypothetical protein